MSVRYDIVFSGQLLPDQHVATVKERLVALFRSPEKVEALFTGEPVLVKRAVSGPDAERYRAAFAQAGAVCELFPSASPRAHLAPPEVRTLPYSSPPQKPGHGTMTYGSPSGDGDFLAPTEPPEQTSKPPAPPTVPRTGPLPESLSGFVGIPAVAQRSAGAGAIPDLATSATPSATAQREAHPGPSQATPGSALGNVEDSAPHPAPEQPHVAMELLGPNTYLAAAVPAAALEVAEEVPTNAAHDLSLPRLYRNESGEILAAPSLGPERPSPGRHPVQRSAAPQPQHPAPSEGAATSASQPPERASGPPAAPPRNPPGVASAAASAAIHSGRSLREQERDGERDHTYGMARGIDAWRLGMTISALSFLLVGVLCGCGSLGALIQAKIGTFLVGVVPTALWLTAGGVLWAAAGSLPTRLETATTNELVQALENHKGFWKIWTVVSLVGGGLGVVALATTLTVGDSVDRRSGNASEPLVVQGWKKDAATSGYTVELDCSDGTLRSIVCELAPDRTHTCRCLVDGEHGGEFVSRVEPVGLKPIVNWARDNCDWPLQPAASSNAE